MVLDFGKGGLFSPSALEQDTGLLNERWGQSGSTIKNFTATIGGGDATVRTVPAGKRLFINYISVNNAGTSTTSYVRDGNGGTIKLYNALPGTSSVTHALVTPLYFDTSLYYDEVSSGSGSITFSGWEEAL